MGVRLVLTLGLLGARRGASQDAHPAGYLDELVWPGVPSDTSWERQ